MRLHKVKYDHDDGNYQVFYIMAEKWAEAKEEVVEYLNKKIKEQNLQEKRLAAKLDREPFYSDTVTVDDMSIGGGPSVIPEKGVLFSSYFSHKTRELELDFL